MVLWLVVCFEDKSNNNKNKRNIFVCLMCSANVCTDMRMVGCVSGPQPKVKGASTAVLLLSCATADCEYGGLLKFCWHLRKHGKGGDDD